MTCLWHNETRQPTPGARLAACWTSLARRGCACSFRNRSQRWLGIFRRAFGIVRIPASGLLSHKIKAVCPSPSSVLPTQ
jgi:hypothetical protein